MAAYANISADQGATFQTSLEVEDTKGDPLDLTNFTLYGQIRRTYKSDVAENFVITKPDPEGGVIQIELTDTQTSAMKSGRYVYDVYGIDGDLNKTIKLLEGIFELIPSVTKIGP
jgi:hypothetical protein